MMVTIHLTGQVTEDGELVFETPKNLPPGEVQITIKYLQPQLPIENTSIDDQDITDEESK